MSYMIGVKPPAESIAIERPADAAKFLKDLATINDEVFAAIYLDADLNVTGSGILASGTLNSVVVSPPLILRYALLGDRPAVFTQYIIVAHNHPGQRKAKPSDDDVHQAINLRIACQYLLKPLLDSIVIGADGNYHSFLENGKVWKKSAVYSTLLPEATRNKGGARVRNDDIRPFPDIVH